MCIVIYTICSYTICSIVLMLPHYISYHYILCIFTFMHHYILYGVKTYENRVKTCFILCVVCLYYRVLFNTVALIWEYYVLLHCVGTVYYLYLIILYIVYFVPLRPEFILYVVRLYIIHKNSIKNNHILCIFYLYSIKII